MFKYLFFDDQKLFARENTVRCYGKPELLKDSIYRDSAAYTAYGSDFVLRTDDGKYHRLYMGRTEKSAYQCYIAVSDDGIHFEPEDVTDRTQIENRVAKNQVLDLPNGEIGCIIEDLHNDPSERYKLMFCRFDVEKNMRLVNVLYVSPDLYHWTELPDVRWHPYGTEPICGAFYNTRRECFTLLVRPYAGTRRVGYIETKDWRTYTPFTMCLQADSIDPPLAEIYGMPACEYDGWYIGWPYIFDGFDSGLHSKYTPGTIKPELAYSLDGNHWQRSLRVPFIDGMDAETVEKVGRQNPMVWAANMLRNEDGSMNLYCTASDRQHGVAFQDIHGDPVLMVYRLRKDGFICLKTDNPNVVSSIATRENVWWGGELHVNLSAKKATVAVYESEGVDNNQAGTCHLVDGYHHEDCIPFSGDSSDWVPVFRSGKKISELANRTLVLELRFEDGAVYSLSGDFEPVMNMEAPYFRKYGKLPPRYFA